MHIPEQQRHDGINGLAIRRELKLLLTRALQIGPFEEYFKKPPYFYSQGWPDSPGDWPTFANRTLLPLWEHSERIYALDLGVDPNTFLSWNIECPDEYRILPSVDAGVFEMIYLHVWEYGGVQQEANEAIHFAEQIALPNFEQLRRLLNKFVECTTAEIDEYRSSL